jgi:iron complex outermembrane recepter protein
MMNDKIFKTFFLIEFLLIFGSKISGQNNLNDTVSYKNLGEVIVTANRLSVPLKVNPGAVSLVSTPVLTSMPRSISIDEALRLVPGVRIDNQANGSRIHLSVRGQGILSERGLRGIKVLLDGIPVNDPTGFASDLYDVDWSAVNCIEILRGPSASLHGGGANAGILNIKTPDGGEKKVNGQFYSSLGSNGFFKVLAQMDGTVDKAKYRATYSNFGGNGYRDHTAFRGSIFSEKMVWQPGERTKVTQMLIVSQYFNQNAEGLNISQLDNPRQANPDAIPLNEFQETKRITNGLVSEVKISANQEILLSVFLKATDYREPGSSAVQYRTFITPGGSVQYCLKWSEGIIHNHLSAGIDFQFQNIKEHKVPNIKVLTRTETFGAVSRIVMEDTLLLANQTIAQSSEGVFLIDRLELGSKLNALFSMRYDILSNKLTDKMNRPGLLSGTANFTNFTARFGLVYNFSPAFNTYANIGQGYLPPATEELINNPVSFGGFNKDLEPATSVGEEVGIRGYAESSFYYDLTVFWMNTKNDFYRYRMPLRPLETFYGNMGSTKRAGVEAFMNWTPFRNFTIQLAYTWSDFKFASPDSIVGVGLPNSPANQLYADVSYKFAKHFEIGLSTEWQSRWFIYTDKVHSNIYQEGFNLYHSRVSYNFEIGDIKATASFYCKNLADKQYIAFTEPDPDGNSYQPSALREIFVSIRLRF